MEYKKSTLLLQKSFNNAEREKSLYFTGFTLVELIVVITILAILATVAFTSLQGFGVTARDSARISDLNTIEKALVLHRTKGNTYPDPEGVVSFTYSGAVVWNQGTFGVTALRALSSINTIPTDPLTNSEYAYSTTMLKNEFQVAGVLEGDGVGATNILVGDTYASGNRTGKTVLVGDYNGKIAKTTSGITTYLLALPTIISGDMTLLDIQSLITAQKLAYNRSGVVPGSYADDPSSDFDDTQILNFTPVPFELFVGDAADLEEELNQVAFFKNLQNAYSGSFIITINQEINNIVNIDLSDINNASSQVKNLASTVINNNAKIEVPNYSSTPVVQVDPTCGLTQVDIDELNTVFSASGYNYADAQTWCNLTIINATYGGNTGIPPNGLWKLTNLTELQLGGNSFSGPFPDGLFSLTNLLTVYLNGNEFTGPLPDGIGNLVNLTYMNINKNNLTGPLPDSFGNLTQLTEIDMRWNDFTGTLPESFGNLDKLENLYLSHNQFSGFNTTIDQMDALRIIRILNNPLISLPDALANKTNIYSIDLSGTNLGVLSNNFTANLTWSDKTRLGVTDSGQSMTIGRDGTHLIFTVFP